MKADLFIPYLEPTAVDFGKLRDSAAHFDQIAEDCGRTNRYISTPTAAADFGK
jgi:phosphoribulokinase